MKYLFIGLGAFALLLVVFPFALGFLPAVASPLEDIRTEATSNAGLSCTSSITGTCTITLTDPSSHGTMDDTLVMETSPGSADRTATSTLDIDNRTGIDISGLSSTPTAYLFTVTYEKRASDVSVVADQLMRNGTLVIFFTILGSIATGVLAIFGIHMMRSRI